MIKDKKHIHVLGIAGTFMAGVAVLAKQRGYQVTGTDEQCYPPMSDILQAQGIEVTLGYDTAFEENNSVDLYLIGNALSRGNPAVEWIIQKKLPFSSGAQWLAQTILMNKHVLAVSGTHGKTTTASMLAWILDFAGKQPGFLVGGAVQNFNCSARATQSDYFVIEADEYDTAFFDKQPKFMHYWPSTLIINNLEFDHADIYSDLQAIQKQFSYLLRLIPKGGCVIAPDDCNAVQQVIDQGCWSTVERFGFKKGDWQVQSLEKDCSRYQVLYQGKIQGEVEWGLMGQHNIMNALAAIAASHHVGVDTREACRALALFKAPKRRLEKKLEHQGIVVYDDFAHHPTAILATLTSLRAKYGTTKRLLCVLELGSYTMRGGYHQYALPKAIQLADKVYFYAEKDNDFKIKKEQDTHQSILFFHQSGAILQQILGDIKRDDIVVLMSNRSLGGLSTKLVQSIPIRDFE